jgi:hypothetical protein
VADPELAADWVQVGELEGDGFRSAQAAGVEQAQKGGVASAPRDCVLAMASRRGCPCAGLKQALLLGGGEVASAGLELPAEGIHVDREVVLLSAQ